MENKTNINWYPGHMAKTKKEIMANLQLIDIVYEIVDARIPFSSKNNDFNDLIKNKPRILIMTKKDLCDINKTNEWVKYYQNLGYKVVLLDLIKDNNLNELLSITKDIGQTINLKRTEKGMIPKKLRILIIGIPNVGKSTLINRLVGKKATNVGNKPGVTKNLEWIRINKDLELLDTPGVLNPKIANEEIAYNLSSLMAISETVFDKEDIAIYIINKMRQDYFINLKGRYNLNDTTDAYEIVNQIGKKSGAIINNDIDYNRVYNIIIKDFNNGYLGKITFDKISK